MLALMVRSHDSAILEVLICAPADFPVHRAALQQAESQPCFSCRLNIMGDLFLNRCSLSPSLWSQTMQNTSDLPALHRIPIPPVSLKSTPVDTQPSAVPSGTHHGNIPADANPQPPVSQPEHVTPDGVTWVQSAIASSQQLAAHLEAEVIHSQNQQPTAGPAPKPVNTTRELPSGDYIICLPDHYACAVKALNDWEAAGGIQSDAGHAVWGGDVSEIRTDPSHRSVFEYQMASSPHAQHPPPDLHNLQNTLRQTQVSLLTSSATRLCNY